MKNFEGLRKAAGAALTILLLATAIGAQQATPTPVAEGPARAGNFDISSSIEFGVRGVSVDGSHDKYRSDFNYQAGVRLFDSSFLARSREGRGEIFDELLVTSAGFGGDPQGFFRLHAEKGRWYKVDAQFRRNRYDNFINCCNQSQVRLPGAATPGRGEHFAQTVHKFGDIDFKLLPTNRNLRFNAGYTFDRYGGQGGSSLSYARDDFQLGRAPWSARSDEVRGGVEARLGKLDLALTQGLRGYRDDSVFVSGPNVGNAGPPGNISVLDTYFRQQPTRGRAWYTRLSAHTQLANRFDITARYVHTNSRTRFTYFEDITGRGSLENTNVIIDRNLNTGANAGDDTRRPTHIFDVGFTAKVSDRLRISNTFRHHSFDISGALAYQEVRVLRRVTNGQPLTPSPIVLNVLARRELDLRRFENSIELDYEFGPRFSFFVGHRYQDRRLESFQRGRVYPLNALVAGQTPAEGSAFTHEEEAENSTNGFFAGFKARPARNWTVWFDANRGTTDNAFTRVDYYDTLSFRMRNRVELRRGLNLNASFVTRDNNNPGVADETLLGVPEFDVDIRSRIFTSSLDWNAGERYWLSTGYTYQHVTSDIGIIFNPGATNPAAGLGRGRYFLRDHFVFFHASARVFPALTLYGGYRCHNDRGQGDRRADDAAGLFIRSLPLTTHAAETRAVVRLQRNLDWTVGYEFHNYNERDPRTLFPDLYVNQDYRAHLPYTSLRIYFGRRE